MSKGKTMALTGCPVRSQHLQWQTGSDGLVTLQVENRGWANRLTQWLLFRPRTTAVHLDALGSFVWQQLDGTTTLQTLGQRVEKQFGEAAQPLYPRLCSYFRILESYRFIRWA